MLLTAMPIWLDWFTIVVGLGGMTAGLLDKEHGRRLVIVSAILVVTSASRLVPDSLRPIAWSVGALLLVYALATTPRAIYRRMRIELTLAAAAVAVIVFLELTPGVPRPIMMALLILLVLLIAAFAVLAVARSTKPGA